MCVEWEGFALISISIIKSIKFLTLFLLLPILKFGLHAYVKNAGFEYIDELNIMPPVVYPQTATTTSNMMMSFSWLFPWENSSVCSDGKFSFLFSISFNFFSNSLKHEISFLCVFGVLNNSQSTKKFPLKCFSKCQYHTPIQISCSTHYIHANTMYYFDIVCD